MPDVTPPVVATPPVTPPAPAPPAPAPPVVPPAQPETPPVPLVPITPPAQPVVALKLPEKAVIDQSALDRTTALVTGLPAEQAQKVVDHVNAEVQAYWNAKEQEASKLRTETWVQQVKDDATLGGANLQQTLARAAMARQAYFTPEFDKMLEETGLGNHPEYVRAMAKVGADLEQSKLRQPNLPVTPQGGPKTIAQQLWPNMKSAVAQ